MSQYALSIDPALVAQAERLVSLDGRTFPTLVVRWETSMLGQDWQTTLVLDYSLPLPPLRAGTSFNEVRVAAYTEQVPTKFLYFGTELNAEAPRVAPEMENTVAPASSYQEYRLTADSCFVPYLELIQTTPRIFGNGPQDYYSPPIKVERFDAGSAVALTADHFRCIVTHLSPISSEALCDPRQGFWHGARFVGTQRIAILRQGKVVGLHDRASKAEVVPPEVIRRDPNIDVKNTWVAVDFGTSATAAAIGDGNGHEWIRIGTTEEAMVSRDFEIPSAVSFGHLTDTVQAWRDRVILPLTRWGDVLVGAAAVAWQNETRAHGKDRAERTMASINKVGSLPLRMARGEEMWICGQDDLKVPQRLLPPALPVIDEEGIGTDDPFDPVELYAYYLGLNVNRPEHGIHLRYALGMPTGYDDDLRRQVIAQFRRGILRSLPAGMVAYDDFERLQIVDAGPNVLSFASHALKVFGVLPKPDTPIHFVAVDAGATETSVLCGQVRLPRRGEQVIGSSPAIDHVKPSVLHDFGGERLLHRMAHRVAKASLKAMVELGIPFAPPSGTDGSDGASELFASTIEAQTNTQLIVDAIRPILDASIPSALPERLHLYGRDHGLHEVPILIDRAGLVAWLNGQMDDLAKWIHEAIIEGFAQVTRDATPFSDLRLMLGGRLSMHAQLVQSLKAVLPDDVRIHQFVEPTGTDKARPTVKLATVLGILSRRYQRTATSAVKDERHELSYRVGRQKGGQFRAIVDGSVGYDIWRAFGACTKPEVEVLFTTDPTQSLSGDHPSLQKVTCSLGYDAVGYRIYIRALSPTRVEVSVGPPGGRPSDGAVSVTIDLDAGAVAKPSSAGDPVRSS